MAFVRLSSRASKPGSITGRFDMLLLTLLSRKARKLSTARYRFEKTPETFCHIAALNETEHRNRK
jgi:hypothetical protein